MGDPEYIGDYRYDAVGWVVHAVPKQPRRHIGIHSSRPKALQAIVADIRTRTLALAADQAALVAAMEREHE